MFFTGKKAVKTPPPASESLNPAVGFYEKNGNRRWTRMNADFHEKRLSTVG
jgi:hypothetical protein